MLFNTFFWCITSIPKKVINIFSTSAIIFITCLNRHHTRNNIRYKGNINNTSVIIFFNKQLSYFLMAFCVDQVYFLGDFRKLNKAPSNGTCLGEPPGGFCDVGRCCCCFPHWRFLRFRATFPCHWHSNLASQVREVLHQLWALLWLLLDALLLPGVSVTFLPRAIRFWVGTFYPQTLFTLRSFPLFLARFVTQMRAGTPHPGSSSVLALTELSLPADAWAWTTHIL